MQRIQFFFKNTVSKIEDYPLPLTRYIFLFLAILGIRLCLEFFANQRLFKIDDVIHIGLWFIFIVLAFMLQLHLFSKEGIVKVVKLVVCCFSIALSAPLIDLLIAQGKFSKMNYLTINTFGDFVKSYFTMGGASLNRGATIGIRIEILLLVIASWNYIYIKTRSVLRAVLGTFSIYSILFLTGTIPYFIGILNNALGLSYGENDQSTIYLLFTLDISLLLIILYRVDQNLMKIKFSVDSIFNIVLTSIPLIIGIYFARKNYPSNWIWDPTTLYYFPLLFIVYLLLLFFMNSPKPKDELTTSDFKRSNGIFFVLALTSACISFFCFFSVILSWGILFLLYEQPLRFYRNRYLTVLLHACLGCSFLFIGFMTFGGPMIGIDNLLLLTVFIISGVLTFVKNRFLV